MYCKSCYLIAATILATVGAARFLHHDPEPTKPTVIPSPSAAPTKPPETNEPKDIKSIADSLPDLPRKDGAVTLPLTTEGPVAWRPVRDGVEVKLHPAPKPEQPSADKSDPNNASRSEDSKAEPFGVTVAYTRTKGKPAGAAMVVKPGSLTDLKQLKLKMTTTRTQRLMVCLKDSAGAVWTFPSISVSQVAPIDTTLEVSDIQPDAYQNPKPVVGKFDPSTVVMITVLDIGGYMSIDEPKCEWTISQMQGVCK